MECGLTEFIYKLTEKLNDKGLSKAAKKEVEKFISELNELIPKKTVSKNKQNNSTTISSSSINKQIKNTLLEAKKITKVKQKIAGAPWELPKDAVWVTRVTPAQLTPLTKAGMEFSLIENFGNPFVVTGKPDKNVAMNVEMGGPEEVSIMFYNWLKNGVIPEKYPKEQLANLESRRNFILSNIAKIKNAKTLWYWRAPDNKITHVDALAAIAEDTISTGKKEFTLARHNENKTNIQQKSDTTDTKIPKIC